MKEKIINRMDRIEEFLREENVVPMVVGKNIDGSYDWNGVHYDNDGSFNQATKTILGDVRKRGKPLVVISINPPQVATAKNDVQP